MYSATVNQSYCRHSLIAAKITHILSNSHDQVILNSVQAIIQNMVANEDNNQQLHYLQSCGFGGLWRFAGPFVKVTTCEMYRTWFFKCITTHRIFRQITLSTALNYSLIVLKRWSRHVYLSKKVNKT